MASALGDASADEGGDPFVTRPQAMSKASSSSRASARYSQFDAQMFALRPDASPEQARLALQAHLDDTERRLAEAGRLGNALVGQRRELTERLREVEQLGGEGELGADLRLRLVEIEKEFHDVARDSARAFLPKQRVPSNEAQAAAGSPFVVPDAKSGRRSVSPSKLESIATGSPTKFSVPNRKLRNQPANRMHDIEFAAEISTSLLAQVRSLQQLLLEREEELRDVKADKARVEVEAETMQQRVKTLDESEHRYKDENWNLETQIDELMAAQREASDREKRLAQNVKVLSAEKSATQRELDEVKLQHSKLTEEHAAAVKQHDIEVGTAKRNMAMAESERSTMQRKVEDLTTQNQELAKAFSLQRGRAVEREQTSGMSDEDAEAATDRATPEHSPPPSPVKNTPRHSVLESETLKTSLYHANRTLQSLRANNHREKTEKLELKRMLQEARDELERARSEAGGGPGSGRRNRKVDSREFKKPAKVLSQLGASRSSRTEMYVDEAEWEDQAAVASGSGPGQRGGGGSSSDYFETANETAAETSDAAFETAHERGTETEEFHTGAEELSDSDDDAATETESPSRGAGKSRAAAAAAGKRPSLVLGPAGSRQSFHSTASTSNDEEEDADFGGGGELKTPTQGPLAPPQRMRPRGSRGALVLASGAGVGRRTARAPSEEPFFQSSPANSSSFLAAGSSAAGTPQQHQQGGGGGAAGQSLFAELADFGDSDEESLMAAGGAMGLTPSRSLRSVTPASSSAATRPQRSPLLLPPLPPKLAMVDAQVGTDEDPASKPEMVEVGVNTEPEPEPELESEAETEPEPELATSSERPMSMDSVIYPAGLAAAGAAGLVAGSATARHSHASTLSYSDASAQHDGDLDDKLAQFPAPPTTPAKAVPARDPAVVTAVQTEPPELSLSAVVAQHVEPRAEPEIPPPALAFSPVLSEKVEPVAEPDTPPAPPAKLELSTVMAEHIEPVAEPETPLPPPPVFAFSSIAAEHVPPREEPEEPIPAPEPLAFSSVLSESVEPVDIPEPPPLKLTPSAMLWEHVQPVSPKPFEAPRPVTPPPLVFSSLQSVETEPVSPKRDAFMIPRDRAFAEEPTTPSNVFLLGKSRKGKDKDLPVPFIAEDETRQSPSDAPTGPETPESQRPFKELSTNSDARPPRGAKQQQQQQPPPPPPPPKAPVVDSAAQTALTADAIDLLLQPRRAQTHDAPDVVVATTPSTVRQKRSQESMDSVVRTRSKPGVAGPVAAAAAAAAAAAEFRPSSASSSRSAMQSLPPLPPNHREAIEAARTGSAGGGQGTVAAGSMGPPPLPASVLAARSKAANPSAFRPRTPQGAAAASSASSVVVGGGGPNRPISPVSGRGTPTPRPVRTGSVHGNVDAVGRMQSPSRYTHRSRQSSVSSFASEIDNRFGLHHGAQHGGGLDAQSFGGMSATTTTDPRMIQAITQTMIGEYLWKYTRKTGRANMSENRHRRYFWVHPYTRTLYWSDRDPAAPSGGGASGTGAGGATTGSRTGGSDHRAKSVQIEAVRVVTDDNPMPPGLHRKSLIVISPSRTIKFTCTTGQRHETWFNALSYLLLRTAETAAAQQQQQLAETTPEDAASNNLTREDVDEFNPAWAGNRRGRGTGPKPRPPVSLNSYSSRSVGGGGRADSPAVGSVSGGGSVSAGLAASVGMDFPTLTPTPHRNAAAVRPTLTTRLSGYWRAGQGTLSSLRSRSRSRHQEGGEPGGRREGGGPQGFYDNDQAHDSAEELREMIEQQDREAARLENVRACCDGKHDVGTLSHSSRRGRHDHNHEHHHHHNHDGATTAATPTPMSSVRSRA